MWLGAIGFEVQTKDAPGAGTDALITVEILRDNQQLFAGRLDYDDQNDHEPGDNRFYSYTIRNLFFDRTQPLPDGVGQIPSPYPSEGMEFSDNLQGHLKCRLHIHNTDMWTKDEVRIYIKKTQTRATSFDTIDWQVDEDWASIGVWSQDVNMSTDNNQGVTTWTLAV